MSCTCVKLVPGHAFKSFPTNESDLFACCERVSGAQKAWVRTDGLTGWLAGSNRLHASFWLALIMIYCRASQRFADWLMWGVVWMCVRACVCMHVYVHTLLWWIQSFYRENRTGKGVEQVRNRLCLHLVKPYGNAAIWKQFVSASDCLSKKKKRGGGALIGCSLSVARYFIAVSKLILQAHSHLELNSSISEI